MKDGRQYRAYPDCAALECLARWIGHQRFIYNAKVREDRYFRAFQRRFVALAAVRPPVDQAYAHFIGPASADAPSTEWLREVPSQVLRNGAARFAQAYSRFFQGLARRPTLKCKHRRQSVWVTREIFSIEKTQEGRAPEPGKKPKKRCERPGYLIRLGTERKPAGTVRFRAHQPFAQDPNAIVLSVEAGGWFVSFCTDDEAPEPSRDEIGAQLEKLTETELAACTVGVDRNTPQGKQICASSGATFTYSPQQSRRMRQRERARRRYQRQLARRQKQSRGRQRARRRLQRIGQYLGNVRKDFAHKTSHALVEDSQTRVIVFEGLKVKNMTARPKPKQDENGRWVKNGAAAKAGLNTAILGSAWGKVYDFTRYKALRAGKLTVKVHPHGSSQECARCGHAHPDNRPSQAVFVCQRCGQARNADANAAQVIKQRGIQAVRAGEWREKPPKKTMRFKCTSVGPERPEPDPAIDFSSQDPTPVEIHIRHGQGNPLPGRGSMKPETPATAHSA
jgi:putative transposase